MAKIPCVVELAHDLAEIARQTRDPETATRLIVLVNEILTAAGLPPAQPGAG